MDDYLSQAPGKVYSLSAPMAALGMLSLDTATFVEPPPSLIDPNFIQGTEENAQNLQGDADSTLPGFENPWWDILELLVLILYLFVAICLLINWIQSIIRFFQGQQKSTPPPKKSLKPGQPGPQNVPVDAAQEKSFEKLKKEFPDVPPDVIDWLLGQGLSEQQVRNILKKLLAGSMTGPQIEQFLQHLLSLHLSNEQIANFFKQHATDIPTIWSQYLQVSSILGIDRVLYAIANGSSTDYKGYFFQLNWIVAYKDLVVRVEAVDPNNQSAADIILKDGTVIDVKSYDWKNQKKLDDLLRKINKADKTTIERIKKQIQRYKDLYPNRPIVYYFDSSVGKIPPDLEQVFKDADVQVKYWPDPNPTQENPPLNP